MQEIITLIILVIVIAAAGFWTGLCWSDRAFANLEERLRNEKELNAAMAKGIELRDARIKLKDKTIKNYEIIQRELRKQVALLTGINSLPQ